MQRSPLFPFQLGGQLAVATLPGSHLVAKVMGRWPPWGQWGRYDLPHCLIGLDYLDSWSGKSIKTGISIHRWCTDWYWLLTQEIIAAETNIQLLPALNPTRPLHVPKPLLSSKRTKLLASAPLPTKSPWPTETNSRTNPSKARQQNIVNIVNEPSTRHL